MVAKYGLLRVHLFCRVIGFIFFQWDSGDEVCLARLQCYGHAPPDPHSGLPQIDLSVNSDVLIMAEDLQRRVFVGAALQPHAEGRGTPSEACATAWPCVWSSRDWACWLPKSGET